MNYPISSTLVVLDSVDSTNNYANKQLLTKRLENGIVYSTSYQSGGKGQRGNTWESQKDKNLLFSTVIYPRELEAGDQFYISMAVSLAVCNFYDSYLANVSIKWPNDIYVGDDKIAGILIENQLAGMYIAISTIGIGMNLNQTVFVSDAPNPTSIAIKTGNEIDNTEALKQVCELLSETLSLIDTDREKLESSYLSRLYRKGKWCTYEDEEGVFEGMIEGVSEYGQLIVCDREGKLRTYNFKEVQYKK